MSRSAARSAPSAQVPRISPRSRLMFFARPSDQRGSRKRVSPGANRNARPRSVSTPPSSSACAYACVCCAPTLGRQLAMSIVVTPLIDGAWRPLARQLARSHQEFVDRARALAPFADRPHDERLAAAHVAGGEHAIDAGAVVVGAGPRAGVLDAFGVARDTRGNARAGTDDYRTSVDRVFAAGDMRRGQSLVVWAIREGRQCARAVDEFLMGSSELPR